MFTLEESALLGRMLRVLAWAAAALVAAAAYYVFLR
jgi:hypothetical protein